EKAPCPLGICPGLRNEVRLQSCRKNAPAATPSGEPNALLGEIGMFRQDWFLAETARQPARTAVWAIVSRARDMALLWAVLGIFVGIATIPGGGTVNLVAGGLAGLIVLVPL